MKYLYVDGISPDRSFGVASSKLKVALNFSVLGRSGKSNPAMFSAGKYVCVMLIDREERPSMVFFDVGANPSSIHMILAEREPSPQFKQQFTSMVEAVNSNYKNVASKYELFVGDPPNISIVEE